MENAASASLLHGVGIGLRHRHFRDFLERKPDVPWLEVHTENFFAPASSATQALADIRRDYPLSAHCVGLSLGSAAPVSDAHLAQVKRFAERFQPALISDHLSWSAASGMHVPDLLPVPYTEEALATLVANIGKVQDTLGRRILIENPSSYLSFASSAIPEQEFMVTVAKRSGCGILLDLNNVYVSCRNLGWDAEAYLAAIPPELVAEIHLAGYSVQEIAGREVLVDTHGASVTPPVWELFRNAVSRFHAPVLVEWDTEVPELAVLLAERERAAEYLSLKV